ncbi:hypothetical protein BCR44DRAFT_1508018 [Catenaria anguillulae PL171]|uniref:Uncharacterized protein n=1 Tax=Catenaria anguillulae PL171 TaxID=765915 RepID=A0A1Y2H0H9_9FUNG|nr:hypothetical protein BCR44DRAFT_1508018 [Catenaria anguillulae PL171]
MFSGARSRIASITFKSYSTGKVVAVDSFLPARSASDQVLKDILDPPSTLARLSEWSDSNHSPPAASSSLASSTSTSSALSPVTLKLQVLLAAFSAATLCIDPSLGHGVPAASLADVDSALSASSAGHMKRRWYSSNDSDDSSDSVPAAADAYTGNKS